METLKGGWARVFKWVASYILEEVVEAAFINYAKSHRNVPHVLQK